MKFNKTKVILIIVMSITLISAVLVSTLAIWTQSYEDEKTVEVPVEEYNPSEKYLIFVPLDAEGSIITDEPALEENIISYAAVGYTGLIAEIEIPEFHQPDGYLEKPVTAVLVDDNYMDEAFAGNEIITSIIMPVTIVRIGAGVFSNLENLTTVLIKDDDPPLAEPIDLIVGDYAFSYTTSLETFTDNGHNLIGFTETIFFGSSYGQ